VVAGGQLPVGGQIYLRDNPLLREPLATEHVKARLLGDWGTTSGLTFLYAHLNRAITERELSAMYVTGPGHGGPGLVASTYLEGAADARGALMHQDAGVREGEPSAGAAHGEQELAGTAGQPHRHVDTALGMSCIVSLMASMEGTKPPGKLIHKLISVRGSRADRRCSWAHSSLPVDSSSGPSSSRMRWDRSCSRVCRRSGAATDVWSSFVPMDPRCTRAALIAAAVLL
jgi:hypothetical protein